MSKYTVTFSGLWLGSSSVGCRGSTEHWYRTTRGGDGLTVIEASRREMLKL